MVFLWFAAGGRLLSALRRGDGLRLHCLSRWMLLMEWSSGVAASWPRRDLYSLPDARRSHCFLLQLRMQLRIFNCSFWAGLIPMCGALALAQGYAGRDTPASTMAATFTA